MSESPLRLIKKCVEYLSIDDINGVPRGIRGIYVLYKYHPGTNAYDVVYVGMARTGIAGRLRSHRKHKAGLWDYCSIFEVWDNIRNEEIEELAFSATSTDLILVQTN